MPTYTDPVVINDGTANRTFTFQNSRTDGKAFVQVWKDLAAAASAKALLKSKFDESSPNVARGVLQVTEALPTADGTLYPCTFNISMVIHKEHVVADLQKRLTILIAGATATVQGKLLNRI